MPVIKKITELVELVGPADGDFVVIVDISEALDVNKTKKILFSTLLSAILKIVHRRQGGSVTDWNTGGTTSYTPTSAVKIQTGARTVSITAPSNASNFSVTFPAAFSNKPVVFISLENSTNDLTSMRFFAQNVTSGGFTLQYDIGVSVTHNVTFTWMAIGE